MDVSKLNTDLYATHVLCLKKVFIQFMNVCHRDEYKMLKFSRDGV